MYKIAERIQVVRNRIKSAEENAQRTPSCVKLLAVSKTRTSQEIAKAFECGITAFGENYLQEAELKQDQLKELDIEWHFIGPIQSNKTLSIANRFNWVHSVDRLKIAERLSRQRSCNEPLNICIQVNISEENTKSGVLIDELEPLIQETLQLPNLKVRGLMTIPSANSTHDELVISYQKMRQIQQKIQQDIPHFDTLSMGMSNDFELAIQEGSHIVRIGTALFGPRNYNKTH